MPEFTGERVIPGLVDTDLLNEHVARYRFAARFARGLTVLDAGCGSGYGTAEFAEAASVTGIDISAEAIRLARETFGRPGVRFLQAGCESLPFPDQSFDLITAFEVIEHLEHWPALLTEARRVLNPSGILIVSTPNKAFYAESRAAAGPNPFHHHEFEYAEFESALSEVFPHVRIWTQNHAETIVFAPVNPATATPEAQGPPDAASNTGGSRPSSRDPEAITCAYTSKATGDTAPEHAGFFVAACSRSPIETNEVYAWLPQSANLLRERQRHVAKLEGELAKKDAWLERIKEDHAKLHQSHQNTLNELRQRNEWAARLNLQLDARVARIVELQEAAKADLAWIRQLESEIEKGRIEIGRLDGLRLGLETEVAARTEWARSIEQQLEVRTEHVRLQANQIEEHEQHLAAQAERLRELEALTPELERLRAERQLIANSKWMRLGRRLNLGPAVNE